MAGSDKVEDNIRSPLNIRRDLIGSASSIKDIIAALAKRGCPDLTPSIDLVACSQHPHAGGGFCDVYKGALSSGMKIAIKSLRIFEKPGDDQNSERTRILKRAARELYHWSKPKHPNVLPLMGLAVFRGHMSMVSEWMDNGDLTSYVRCNPTVDKISLCMDVCAGLHYIHMNGMVHGDLKAANIVVSPSGTAMITDFGNAQLQDLSLMFSNTTKSSLSLRWAAPELFRAETTSRLTKEADVYAYGMTVLEALTGKVPFDGLTDHQVIVMVAFERKVPPRPTANVSDELWGLLQHCWAWDSSERLDIGSVELQLEALYPHTLAHTHEQNNLGSISPTTSQPSSPLTELGSPFATTIDVEEEDPERLGWLADLAKSHFKQGRLAEAESVGVRVMLARKRVLGGEHAATIRSIIELSMIYYSQGRLADSELLDIEVLLVRKRVLGETHPQTLQAIEDLAKRYCEQGRFGEAEALQVEALSALERVYGEDHSYTLRGMTALAMTHYKQGRFVDAERLYVKLVAIRKRLQGYGEHHRDTVRDMQNLAETYKAQGRVIHYDAIIAQVYEITARH